MGEDGDSQWQDLLGDEGPLQDERVAEAQERDVRHSLLNEALETLNERERHILTERRLTDDPKTLEDLSQVYEVSRERVRQIEVRAFEKLQKAMLKLAGERRSEEHTSALQSLMRISYAVFCLKKKKKNTNKHTPNKRIHTLHKIIKEAYSKKDKNYNMIKASINNKAINYTLKRKRHSNYANCNTQ